MATYTAAEMVQAAKEAGYDRVSERLIDDWVASGLLDRPDGGSRGRYGRAPGTWGENQVRLFLSLLEARGHTRAIPELCNVPVWLWLWWGDDYVPQRQMKKALATWATAAKKKNDSRATQGIDQLVRTWGSTDTPWAATQRLAQTLPSMVHEGKVDEKRSRPHVASAFGRADGEPARSTAEGDLSVDGYQRVFRAKVEAIARLTTPLQTAFTGGKRQSPIADDLFEWARVFYLTTRHGYDRKRPHLAEAFGPARYGDGTVDEIVTESCADVALILGLELTGQIRVAAGSIEDPERWKAGGMRAHLTTSMSDDGIDVEIEVSGRAPLPE